MSCVGTLLSFETDVYNVSPFIFLFFDYSIQCRLYTCANCLAYTAESRVRDLLSDYVAVVSYTEIEISGFMFIEDRSNGNNDVLYFSGALLELNLFRLFSDVDYFSPRQSSAASLSSI